MDDPIISEHGVTALKFSDHLVIHGSAMTKIIGPLLDALLENKTGWLPGTGWYPIGMDNKSYVLLGRNRRRMPQEDAKRYCTENDNSTLLELYSEQEYKTVLKIMQDSFKEYNKQKISNKNNTYYGYCAQPHLYQNN